MSQRLLGYLSLLAVLPIFAVQVRLLIYKRIREGDERMKLREALLESIPHDLSMMGMTLGIAASLLAGSHHAQHDIPLLVPLVVFVPVFAVSLIPLLKSSMLR